MSKIVFVLGAGASVDAGAPVMNDFLDRAEKVRGTIQDDDAQAFDLTFRGIEEINAGLAWAHVADNLEAIFSVFEMAKLCGRLGRLESEKVKQLPDALRRVILRTLEAEIHLRVSNERILSPDSYDSFASMLRRKPHQNPHASVITFNYDTCLEIALHLESIRHTYCLQNETNRQELEVLKLHGSLNWYSYTDGTIHYCSSQFSSCPKPLA
jgi:hypothetical protein